MPTPIETLKKIEYQNIEQFLIDINRNFAVVENSPLYKGIPGDDTIGTPGLKGVRGIKFLFVNLTKFQEQFPGELSGSSQIDINYINTKLLVFENKQKLLTALGITEFVDKDIIVLTNTIMVNYDYIENKFTNTGIAFNEQANLLNNVQQQIETYVEYYVTHNQTINNLSNIFESYVTYAKNYTDTNNVFITSSLTQSSVFSPFIPGYNSNIGILMNDHKYFGFSESQFPKNNNGTIVFGSMKKYYDLLMSTISTDQNETLTSDYAPGVNNIPAAVFLQDTENAGILIGYKGRPNLKRFADIYKNDLHELVIKSDAGINASEYSKLILHKDYLKFDKIVLFGNDLEVSRDTKLYQDIQNEFIKTGKFTEGASINNSFNTDIVEFGKQGFGNNVRQSIVKNIADIEMYKYYIDNVLVTTSTGQVSKAYSLEKTVLQNSDVANLNLITELVNSPNKILTSYYFGYLARKINAVSSFTTNNYWRKNQFNTGDISSLWLSQELRVDGNINLSGLIQTDIINSRTTITGNRASINSLDIFLNEFKGKVLITDANGFLSKNYSLETNVLTANELINGQQLNIFNELDTKIISTKYYAHLAKKINNITTDLFGNYWKKSQYNTFEIPNLYLSDDLIVRGNVIFKPNNNLEVFKVNKATNEVSIGTSTSPTKLSSNIINLQQYLSKVLVTGPTGDLLNSYFIEPNNHNNLELSENTQLSDNIGIVNDFGIAKSTHIRFLNKKINQLINWVTNKYWSKLQFPTGIIPDLKTNTSLTTDGIFTAGESTNPNISTNGNNSNFGKTGGTTTIKGADILIENIPNAVIITDMNGKVLPNYSIEYGLPNSGPIFGVQTDGAIYSDFWDKASQPQNFNNTPFSPFKILSSTHFEHLVRHLKAVRTLLFDRPTYTEVNSMLSGGIPQGTIIMWSNTFGPHDASKFTICDGRVIPGSSGLLAPNMIDKFLKGSLNPNVIGGNINHLKLLDDINMPIHSHDTYISNGGAHDHLLTVSTPNTTAPLGGISVGLPYIFNNVRSGTNSQNYTLSGSSSLPDIAKSSYNTGHSHIATVSAAGHLNPTPLNIEPHSYSIIFLIKN